MTANDITRYILKLKELSFLAIVTADILTTDVCLAKEGPISILLTSYQEPSSDFKRYETLALKHKFTQPAVLEFEMARLEPRNSFY